MNNQSSAHPARQTRIEDVLSQGGWRLADFEKMPIKGKDENLPDSCVPKKGFIKVVPIAHRKMTNGQTMQMAYRLKCVYDHDTYVVYGQNMGLDNNGNIRWKTIMIDDERQFDLSKPSDRRDFYVLLHDTQMEGGPNFKGKAKLKMIDPEKAAKQMVEKRNIMREADDIVRNLTNDGVLTELSDFAVQFGFDPKQSVNVLQQMLYEKADKDPYEIVKRFNDPDRKIWSLVKRAMMFNVIEQRPDGLYFGGLALGMSENNAVERIKAEPQMMTGISTSIDNKLGKAALPIAKKSEESVADKKPNFTKKKDAEPTQFGG